MRKVLFIGTCLLVLAGCGGGLLSLIDPQKTYDGDLPIEETAVLGPSPTCQITPFIMAVDGRKTSSLQVGYPRVIRLQPGHRVLSVQTVGHGMSITTSSGIIELKLDVQAGHTYLLNTAREGADNGQTVKVWIDDKGLNQAIPKDIFC